MRQKNNYVMRKLNTPKRVTLPNGWTFLARYKRAPRSELPPHITIRWRYRQRAAPRDRRRRGQRGRGIFDFVKKVIKNRTVRALGRQVAKHQPTIYNAASSKTKNDKVRRALQSDTANNLVNCLKPISINGQHIKRWY